MTKSSLCRFYRRIRFFAILVLLVGWQSPTLLLVHAGPVSSQQAAVRASNGPNAEMIPAKGQTSAPQLLEADLPTGQALQAPISSTILSDDFNQCALGSTWEFLNPLGDGSMLMNGTQLLLGVPAGTSHNVFDNGIPAPRVMQAVDNTDFEILVKFESPMDKRYQVQGIIVEQDVVVNAEDFIRFDFYHDGTNTHLYAATIRDGEPLAQIDDIISVAGTSYYLKVRRVGSVWTESYSFDGTNFIDRNFTLTTPITVRKVGVFAANHGSSTVPAHTAIVDYFFNTAAPISNEDGKPTTLTINVVPPQGGTATVTDPSGVTNYSCGDQITVSAVSAAGWLFTGWSGATTSSANPVTFPYDIGGAITATFVNAEQNQLYLPLVSKN